MFHVQIEGAAPSPPAAPDASPESDADDAIGFQIGRFHKEQLSGTLRLLRVRGAAPGAATAESRTLCVVAVPTTLTASDFCTFVGPLSDRIEHMRILRPSNSTIQCYMVLIRFRTQEAADRFFRGFNGRPFSSFAPELCRVVYVARVVFVAPRPASLLLPPEIAASDPLLLPPPALGAPPCGAGASPLLLSSSGGGGGGNSAPTEPVIVERGDGSRSPSLQALSARGAQQLVELPSCPICLDRLDAATSGVLTTVCSHTFHSQCLSRWSNLNCPVCRYTLSSVGSGGGGGDVTPSGYGGRAAAGGGRTVGPTADAGTGGGGSGAPSLLPTSSPLAGSAAAAASAAPFPEEEDPGGAACCEQCGTAEGNWICLICGHVGCSRSVRGHALAHHASSGHSYALELATQRVWDYVSDAYVHRLIAVQAASARGAGGGHGSGSSEWFGDSGGGSSEARRRHHYHGGEGGGGRGRPGGLTLPSSSSSAAAAADSGGQAEGKLCYHGHPSRHHPRPRLGQSSACPQHPQLHPPRSSERAGSVSGEVGGSGGAVGAARVAAAAGSVIGAGIAGPANVARQQLHHQSSGNNNMGNTGSVGGTLATPAAAATAPTEFGGGGGGTLLVSAGAAVPARRRRGTYRRMLSAAAASKDNLSRGVSSQASPPALTAQVTAGPHEAGTDPSAGGNTSRNSAPGHRLPRARVIQCACGQHAALPLPATAVEISQAEQWATAGGFSPPLGPGDPLLPPGYFFGSHGEVVCGACGCTVEDGDSRESEDAAAAAKARGLAGSPLELGPSAPFSPHTRLGGAGHDNDGAPLARGDDGFVIASSDDASELRSTEAHDGGGISPSSCTCGEEGGAYAEFYDDACNECTCICSECEQERRVDDCGFIGGSGGKGRAPHGYGLRGTGCLQCDWEAAAATGKGHGKGAALSRPWLSGGVCCDDGCDGGDNDGCFGGVGEGKADAIAFEYSLLLSHQLEVQRGHYEGVLAQLFSLLVTPPELGVGHRSRQQRTDPPLGTGVPASAAEAAVAAASGVPLSVAAAASATVDQADSVAPVSRGCSPSSSSAGHAAAAGAGVGDAAETNLLRAYSSRLHAEAEEILFGRGNWHKFDVESAATAAAASSSGVAAGWPARHSSPSASGGLAPLPSSSSSSSAARGAPFATLPRVTADITPPPSPPMAALAARRASPRATTPSAPASAASPRLAPFPLEPLLQQQQLAKALETCAARELEIAGLRGRLAEATARAEAAERARRGLVRAAEEARSTAATAAEEVAFLRDINETLAANVKTWEARCRDAVANSVRAAGVTRAEVEGLREEVRDLLFALDTTQRIAAASPAEREELAGGRVVLPPAAAPTPVPPPAARGGEGGGRRRGSGSQRKGGR